MMVVMKVTEIDIPVRHVPVHSLAHVMLPKDVEARRVVLEQAVEEWEGYVVECTTAKRHAQDTLAFLKRETENLEVSLKLRDGSLVRVVCSVCNGSGLKPTAVTSGVIQTKTAFQNIDQAPTTPPQVQEVDPIHRCAECEGKKWLIMQSYRG